MAFSIANVLATVVCGLRRVQNPSHASARHDDEHFSIEAGGQCLSREEIDNLCESLNFGKIAFVRVGDDCTLDDVLALRDLLHAQNPEQVNEEQISRQDMLLQRIIDLLGRGNGLGVYTPQRRVDTRTGAVNIRWRTRSA